MICGTGDPVNEDTKYSRRGPFRGDNQGGKGWPTRSGLIMRKDNRSLGGGLFTYPTLLVVFDEIRKKASVFSKVIRFLSSARAIIFIVSLVSSSGSRLTFLISVGSEHRMINTYANN